MNLRIEQANIVQKSELLNLYSRVAIISGGIIRNKDEINEEYISNFLKSSIENGIILVGKIDNTIVGEIHAYTPGIHAFRHILSELTIVVDPDYQGHGIGRKIFEQFLRIVKKDYNHIFRIELYVREANIHNVKFYESLVFINEGRQENKILNTKCEFETPLHMAWFNPNFSID